MNLPNPVGCPLKPSKEMLVQALPLHVEVVEMTGNRFL